MCRVKRGTYIPEHGAGEAIGLDVLGLQSRDVRGVVRDKLALGCIVRVARNVCHVLEDSRASNGESLVGVDASLDRAGADLSRPS